MLRMIDPQLIENCSVYADDSDYSLYYVIPQTPSFRLDDNGNPVFTFVKYRFPVDRPDGKKGGGFLIFDVEFVTAAEKIKKITPVLTEQVKRAHDSGHAQYLELKALKDQAAAVTDPPNPDAPKFTSGQQMQLDGFIAQGLDQDGVAAVKFGTVPYFKGTANVTLLDSGGAMVQKITNPANPSLYGRMVTPVTVELSPEGATLLEDLMQGRGGVLQVSYALTTWAKLPPMKVMVWFNSEKFMNFHQQVDIDWSMWGDDSYHETIKQKFVNSESGGVKIDPGTVTDEKVLATMRDWGMKTLEDAVKRMVLGDIPDVSADDRKVPDGIEHLTRDITVDKVASFTRSYEEGRVFEYPVTAQGTVPNVTQMLDVHGKPFKWSDFAHEVDLNDPFFQTLNVLIQVNADFVDLSVFNVEVTLHYDNTPKSFVFTKSDDVGKFSAFVKNADRKYTYEYTVNYKGQAEAVRMGPFESDQQNLTINVGDLGVLRVDGSVGDLNFEQVQQAEVTLTYDDSANGVPPVEEHYSITKDHPSFSLRRPVMQPIRNPYSYQVKYLMQGGKELQGGEDKSRSKTLFINDPFAAQRTVSVRSFGDFEHDLDNILLDLRYTDAVNHYTQTKTIALNKGTPFYDWTFPVISETGGDVSYGGVITRKNGGTPETLAVVPATSNTIVIGKAPPKAVTVSVMPDLIDFSKVKLVKVSLHSDQADPADFIFKSGGTLQTWPVNIADPSKLAYTYTVTFFLTVGGAPKVVGPLPGNDLTILPELPA